MANTHHQYKVVSWHGESRSVWYLVQWPVEDQADWEVIASYRTPEEAVIAYHQWVAAEKS